MKRFLSITGILLQSFFLAFGQPKNVHEIKIRLHNMVGNGVLQTDSLYTNYFDEPFAVKQLKYYIGNLFVIDAVSGKEIKLPETYYLINEKDSASKNITVHSTVSSISGIGFYLGVDSVRNTSGVQTDALDPANGMFWTWSTGYIMAKMEGISPLSKAPRNAITYHIGGFSGNNNVVKKIILPMEKSQVLNSKTTPIFHIYADINKWFSGKNDIRITTVNFCMNPGELANKIAANYADMFRLEIE